jgi:hypothetical protein
MRRKLAGCGKSYQKSAWISIYFNSGDQAGSDAELL